MTGGACARPPQNSAPWVRAARVSWTTSTLFWWLELEHPPTPFFCRGSIFQSTFSGNPCTMPYGLVWIRPTTKHFFRGSVAPWVGRGGLCIFHPLPGPKQCPFSREIRLRPPGPKLCYAIGRHRIAQAHPPESGVGQTKPSRGAGGNLAVVYPPPLSKNSEFTPLLDVSYLYKYI